jgi:hypothetical protein
LVSQGQMGFPQAKLTDAVYALDPFFKPSHSSILVSSTSSTALSETL